MAKDLQNFFGALLIVFFKWAILGLSFFYFRRFNTIDSKKVK